MIKRDELDKILNKFNSLEKELTTAVNDKEKYVSISKEYAEIKPLAEQINIYLSLLKEHEDLNAVLDGNDSDLIEIAKSEISNLKINLQSSEESLKQLLIPKDPLDQKMSFSKLEPEQVVMKQRYLQMNYCACTSDMQRIKIGKLNICLFLILKKEA